jgi:5-formyltetrahydrofolate cyclo-ligase
MSQSISSTLTKQEIREAALQLRDAMPDSERAAASLAICRAVMQDEDFIDARGVHVYLPIRSEVDIRPLIDIAWELGKEVGMMVIDEDGGTRQFTITPATSYRRIDLGILEPVDAEPFDMNNCDLVICPVVAADEECNRLGYGKGYYDQFLTHFPRPTIGVAFECQVFPELPTNNDDIGLDTIYTEKRAISECPEEE